MPPKSVQRQAEHVGKCYFMCRFCDRWLEAERFSAARLQSLAANPGVKPLCRSCAKVALESPDAEDVTELCSLPVESRYAFVMAACGEYEGVPALPVDVISRIFSFIVCRPMPFIADRGDGTFNCTACERGFPSFAAVQQHCRTSQRHVKALQRAAT
mmetsp:Transcript_37306/g.86791  ORF Transcript_37306/g.86791 Transcript_37306/m.86791 type:complete len:157 (-) Transcript_37306:61-531(-)